MGSEGGQSRKRSGRSLPTGEQERREPRAWDCTGAEQRRMSQDLGTMGSAGSAGPGTCRDRDTPAWGLKAASAALP